MAAAYLISRIKTPKKESALFFYLSYVPYSCGINRVLL